MPASLPAWSGRERRRQGALVPRTLALLLAVAALGAPLAAGAAQGGALPVQQVLQRSLRADPGQEYYLYIPGAGARQAAVLVAVHGYSRNSAAHATSLAEHCETYGVVLVAPHFDAEEYRDYQRLGRAGLGGRADVVLDSILSEVASLTGADTERIYLFGFSGGAQFAHRYVLAHPRRVARAVVAAAGWYTFPEPQVDFPYGIGAIAALPGVRFEPEEFLRVPIAVLVGELDTEHKNLRHNEQVDAQQGLTRVERARNWVAAMQAAAAARGLVPQVSFEPVPGMDHSFTRFVQEGRLGERTFAFLFGPPAKPGASAREDRGELQAAGGERR